MIDRKQALCLKCQYCCNIISFYVPFQPESIEFFRARGLKVLMDLPTKRAMVVVPQKCRHLTKDGCAIYSKRPLVCSLFDGSKSPDTQAVCLWNRE